MERIALTGTASLERSCGPLFHDSLRIAAASHGVERIEACFRGNGFSPHRHDTYALGLTLHGIQTFRYRGAEHFSRLGNVILLHPDEMHDGAAGDEYGLIYRMLYLPPSLVAEVDGQCRTLPFVADPVVRDNQLWTALAGILEDLDRSPVDLLMNDVLERIVTGIARQAGLPQRSPGPRAQMAVQRARDFLESHSAEVVRSEALEDVTGLDRYELARQFRRLLGTSPHRFLVMRRLDQAKRLLADGRSIADVAVEVGFADQAHFTRHFRSTFGMTPGRWVNLQAVAL